MAPGEVSLAVSVIDDSLDEPDETFTLVLSDLQGAALGRGSALGTIRDDDEPPALSIADTGPGAGSVTLIAGPGRGDRRTIRRSGDDYGPVEGTLTFANGQDGWRWWTTPSTRRTRRVSR